MKIEEVFKIAEDGGWTLKEGRLDHLYPNAEKFLDIENSLYHHKGVCADLAVIYLDVSWWKSLGKGLGWGKLCPLSRTKEYLPHTPYNGVCWLCVWHSFIDHLASGGTPESYFATIKGLNQE